MNHSTDWINEHTFCQPPHDPAFFNDPYALYRDLHQRGGPVFWQDYGMWCLTGFEAVNAALKDRRFARLPPLGTPSDETQGHMTDFARVEAHSLLQLEPPDHTRLRKRVNRAFVARQIEAMAPQIEQQVNACIDQFIDERSCDLLKTLATPVPVTVIAQFWGCRWH